MGSSSVEGCGKSSRERGVARFVVELGVQTPAGVNVEERPFEGRVVRRMRWPSGPVYRSGPAPGITGVKALFAGDAPIAALKGRSCTGFFHGITRGRFSLALPRSG